MITYGRPCKLDNAQVKWKFEFQSLLFLEFGNLLLFAHYAKKMGRSPRPYSPRQYA